MAFTTGDGVGMGDACASTSTTIPGCSSNPPLASIDCRLASLIETVHDAHDLGRSQATLAASLPRAKAGWRPPLDCLQGKRAEG